MTGDDDDLPPASVDDHVVQDGLLYDKERILGQEFSQLCPKVTSPQLGP